MTRPLTSTSEPLVSLRERLPAHRERPPHDYAIDGRLPALAVAPGDRTEVASLLHAAAAAGLAVVPLGGRTSLAVGCSLEQYEVALDLTALRRVVRYEPDDLTVTVEAGTRLADLQILLRAHGQYLPVDPPPGDDITVGGMLATGRSGAWRGHLGAVRDFVLGIETALPSGELTKAGGRVVKNVAGYDLHRLHTGALGALGVIVEATFKVAPLPAAARSFAASVESIDEACLLAKAVWDRTDGVRGITVLAPEPAQTFGLPPAAAVLLELCGTDPAIQHRADKLAQVAAFGEVSPDLWSELRRLHGDSRATVIRLGVPPSHIRIALDAAHSLGARSWAHFASGAVLVHMDRLRRAEVAQLALLAEGFGGFLTIEAAPVDIRRDFFSGGDTALLAALRERFDPNRTLNPGRWPEAK